MFFFEYLQNGSKKLLAVHIFWAKDAIKEYFPNRILKPHVQYEKKKFGKWHALIGGKSTNLFQFSNYWTRHRSFYSKTILEQHLLTDNLILLVKCTSKFNSARSGNRWLQNCSMKTFINTCSVWSSHWKWIIR